MLTVSKFLIKTNHALRGWTLHIETLLWGHYI